MVKGSSSGIEAAGEDPTCVPVLPTHQTSNWATLPRYDNGSTTGPDSGPTLVTISEDIYPSFTKGR